VPRRALQWPGEVAAALGVSDDYLRKHWLATELRTVRVGALLDWYAPGRRIE
jgi:hypothetical protein